MIGRGTPSIQSNMPRPIGSLLLRLLSRDLQTISMSISSSENSKKPLVLLRFFTGNSSRGGREVRTWAFRSEHRRNEAGARRVNVPILPRVLTVSKESQWREERHSCALAE